MTQGTLSVADVEHAYTKPELCRFPKQMNIGFYAASDIAFDWHGRLDQDHIDHIHGKDATR